MSAARSAAPVAPDRPPAPNETGRGAAPTRCAECGDRISGLHEACPKCGRAKTGETEITSGAAEGSPTSGVDPSEATWRDIAPVLWFAAVVVVLWFLLELYRAGALAR